MIDAAIGAWYRLYSGDVSGRAKGILVDRHTRLLLRKRVDAWLPRRVVDLAVSDSEYTLFQFHDGMLRSDAVLCRIGDILSLPVDEVEALLYVSEALFSAFEYDEAQTYVNRVLLTGISHWRARVLRGRVGYTRAWRWLNLVHSNAPPFELIRRKMILKGRGPLDVQSKRQGVTASQLFSALVRARGVEGCVGRSLGIGAREVAANLEATSALLNALQMPSANPGLGMPWGPAEIVHMWKADRKRFVSTLKSALDGYLLVPWNRVADVRPDEKSMCVMKGRYSKRARTSETRAKTKSEYFVDTAVMAIVRSADDVESLFTHFGKDTTRFAKFMRILSEHLFFDEKLLRSVMSSSRCRRYPEGSWRRSATAAAWKSCDV